MPFSFADSDRFDDYWSLRRDGAMTPTVELPTRTEGRDAEVLCNKVFTRDVTWLKVGR
ncbi:MAG: hypothetical protein OXN84_02625 [Albidovulum sp.]|nr:hypothetical protein [Albidovulum sp.]